MPYDIVTHSQAFYSQLRGIVSNLALLTAVQVLVFMCLERSRGVEPRPLVWRTNVQPFHLLRLLPAQLRTGL